MLENTFRKHLFGRKPLSLQFSLIATSDTDGFSS